LVSIILTTFNRSHIIERAIKSVKNQTYKDWELIIVDDCSSDDTPFIVKKFLSDKIKYIRLSTNKGPAGARNAGMRVAKGEFIAFLDDDDEWLPKKLERQISVFKTLSTPSFIFCNGLCLGTSKKYAWPIEIPSGYLQMKGSYFSYKKAIPPPPSWLICREIFEEIGYFDECFRIWEDIDYLVRISKKFPFYFLNEILVKWHSEETRLFTLSECLIEHRERFIKKYLNEMKRERYYLFRFYYSTAKDCYKLGKMQKARFYYLKAWKLYPYKIELVGKMLKTLKVNILL